MSSDIVIRVQNLSKCYHIYDKPHDRLMQMLARGHKRFYREFWALKDVSFEIGKGETVGIIGRNGSGKSTLLQLICGTLNPTGGDIDIYGRIAALLELGSGFNPEFTGRENVYMNAALLGLSRKEIDSRFDDIAAFADIGEFIEQPVKTYSSGMFVRLAFAVNIVSEPDIMIVDEALAVGDMNFQAKCMTALTRIQERGATVLFVSHDIGALKSLCSRGIYLDQGIVRTIGQAPEVAEQYMRTMREEMNVEQRKSFRVATEVAEKDRELWDISGETQENKQVAFMRSEEFDKRVAAFRYGSGGARITYAELLDGDSRPLIFVEFDQAVCIKIYCETEIDEKISVNYYVMDEKKNLIIGSGLSHAGGTLLSAKKNGCYIVSFHTRVPLHEGYHSIQLQITKPIVLGETAEFLDVINDAIVFQVGRRENMRVWSRVYLQNQVEVVCV
jgi:lipopolysaccharide transport system ATP-binding protein